MSDGDLGNFLNNVDSEDYMNQMVDGAAGQTEYEIDTSGLNFEEDTFESDEELPWEAQQYQQEYMPTEEDIAAKPEEEITPEQEIQEKKDEMQAKMEKINEKQKSMMEKIKEMQDKIQKFKDDCSSKGKEWMSNHNNAINRTLKNMEDELKSYNEYVDNWIKTQKQAVKDALNKELQKIMDRSMEKKKNKAIQKSKQEQAKAANKAKMLANKASALSGMIQSIFSM